MTKASTSKHKPKPVKAWAIFVGEELQMHQMSDMAPFAVYRRRKDAEVWFEGEYVVRVLITEVRK